MAPRIELIPSRTHCIQTTAKQAFSETLERILESDEEDPELGEKLELLRLFLETADFGELRRISEVHLLAGKTVKFVLHLESGEPRHEMTLEG